MSLQPASLDELLRQHDNEWRVMETRNAVRARVFAEVQAAYPSLTHNVATLCRASGVRPATGPHRRRIATQAVPPWFERNRATYDWPDPGSLTPMLQSIGAKGWSHWWRMAAIAAGIVLMILATAIGWYAFEHRQSSHCVLNLPFWPLCGTQFNIALSAVTGVSAVVLLLIGGWLARQQSRQNHVGLQMQLEAELHKIIFGGDASPDNLMTRMLEKLETQS